MSASSASPSDSPSDTPDASQPTAPRNRAEYIWLGLILVVAALLLALQHNRFLTVVNHDAAIFCILAKSLLHGNYMLVSEPNPQPYFTFPPFMSVQLAGLMLLFQNTDIQAMQGIFKSYINLLFLASIPLYYWWTRGLLGWKHAVALTALLAVDPIISKYIADVLSDAPFWALSMGALFSVWKRQQNEVERIGTRENPPTASAVGTELTATKAHKRSLLWSALSLLFIVLCALTRQIGAALVLGYLIHLAMQKMWKQLIVAVLVFAVTVGGWQSYEHFYRSAHRSEISSLNQQGVQEVLDKSPIKLEYVKHFLVDRPVDMDENRSQANVAVLLGNVRDRYFAYTHLLLGQLAPPLKVKLGGQKTDIFQTLPFMLLFWAAAHYGLWQLWRNFRFGALYAILSFGVLLVYPYVSIRFMLPLAPIVLLCVYWGVRDLVLHLRSEKFAPAVRGAALAILPVFLALALTAHLIETIRRVHDGYELKVANVGPSLREGNRAYYETLLWMKKNLPTNAIVISRKPPVTYFYSGRASTAFPFTADSDKIFAYIEEKQKLNPTKPLYIFEDHVFDNSHYLTQAIETHLNKVQLVHTETQTKSRIWAIIHPMHQVLPASSTSDKCKIREKDFCSLQCVWDKFRGKNRKLKTAGDNGVQVQIDNPACSY